MEGIPSKPSIEGWEFSGTKAENLSRLTEFLLVAGFVQTLTNTTRVPAGTVRRRLDLVPDFPFKD
jgi:hypothetical protein